MRALTNPPGKLLQVLFSTDFSCTVASDGGVKPSDVTVPASAHSMFVDR